MGDDPGELPTTVDEAVRILRGLVPAEEQARITSLTEDQLLSLHFGLGQWVRNYFGLWGSNPELLKASGETDADDASGVILRQFWLALRDELPKLH
jgi:hypothetical protein